MILYPRPEPSSIDPSKTRHRFAIESSSNSSNSSNNDWALDSPFYAFTHTPKTTSRAGRVLILLFANPRCPWPCNYLSNVPPPRSLILPPSSLQHLLGDRPATGQPAPSEVQRRNDIRQIGNKSYRKKSCFICHNDFEKLLFQMFAIGKSHSARKFLSNCQAGGHF